MTPEIHAAPTGDEARAEAPPASPRTRTAYAFALGAVGVALAYALRSVVLLAFMGVLLGILFDAIARLGMRRLHLSRSVAVISAAVLALVVSVGTVALCAAPLATEGGELLKELPKKTEKLQGWADDVREKYPIVANYLPSKEPSEKGGDAAGAAKTAFLTASRALDGVITLMGIFFLGLFLALDPERYKTGAARLWPGGSVARRIEILEKIGEALRGYLVTVGVQIVVMAVLWAIGLKLIGIDYWFLFGVIGGVVEIVPYLGPMLGLIPPLAMGATQGLGTVGMLVGLYAVLHVFEGYVLAPWLMHRQVHLPPAIVLLSIMAFGTAFGFLGILIAVPLGTAIYVWVLETRLKDAEERKAEILVPAGEGSSARRAA